MPKNPKIGGNGSFQQESFKFIFIYSSQQNPCDNQNTVLFFLQTCFFLFFLIMQNKRTLSAIRQRTDSAVLSLPFHSAHLYTQRDCTSSLLHFQTPPTNVMTGQSECLKTIIFNLRLAYSVAWHTLRNTHSSLPHTHTVTTKGDLCITDPHQTRATALALSGLAQGSKIHTVLAMLTMHFMCKRKPIDMKKGGA